MTRSDKMIEQHILQYESRLRHIDELLERAGRVAAKSGEVQSELTELHQERERLGDHLRELKDTPSAKWQKALSEKAGPMGVWDAVAGRLECVVERLEGRTDRTDR